MALFMGVGIYHVLPQLKSHVNEQMMLKTIGFFGGVQDGHEPALYQLSYGLASKQHGTREAQWPAGLLGDVLHVHGEEGESQPMMPGRQLGMDLSR